MVERSVISCSKCPLEECLKHVHVHLLSTLTSVDLRSLKHYFLNGCGVLETTFYSPNLHDLQIQFALFILSMQYVTF